MTMPTDPLAEARWILTHPGAAPLAVQQMCWNALKNARGQTVDWTRLRSTAHLSDHAPAPAPRRNRVMDLLDDAAPRIRSRTRAHALRMQYRLPDDGGDAA